MSTQVPPTTDHQQMPPREMPQARPLNASHTPSVPYLSQSKATKCSVQLIGLRDDRPAQSPNEHSLCNTIEAPATLPHSRANRRLASQHRGDTSAISANQVNPATKRERNDQCEHGRLRHDFTQ